MNDKNRIRIALIVLARKIDEINNKTNFPNNTFDEIQKILSIKPQTKRKKVTKKQIRDTQNIL